jgi:hypothetical protein
VSKAQRCRKFTVALASRPCRMQGKLEVGSCHWEVSFAFKNRHRQSGLSGLKSANCDIDTDGGDNLAKTPLASTSGATD